MYGWRSGRHRCSYRAIWGGYFSPGDFGGAVGVHHQNAQERKIPPRWLCVSRGCCTCCTSTLYSGVHQCTVQYRLYSIVYTVQLDSVKTDQGMSQFWALYCTLVYSTVLYTVQCSTDWHTTLHPQVPVGGTHRYLWVLPVGGTTHR